MGLLTYIIAKWRKVLLPICKRSFVWMWPIKLNVRSTWQAERGRRTKKTAMLLNVGKSSFLAALRFSWFWPWDVDYDRGVWLCWCLHTNGWGL